MSKKPNLLFIDNSLLIISYYMLDDILTKLLFLLSARFPPFGILGHGLAASACAKMISRNFQVSVTTRPQLFIQFNKISLIGGAVIPGGSQNKLLSFFEAKFSTLNSDLGGKGRCYLQNATGPLPSYCFFTHILQE